MSLAPLVVDDASWEALLAVRTGRAARLPPGDNPVFALYGPLAAPPGTRRVSGQVGQSLDGRVATPAGDARDISGPDGLAHLHRLRALVDGVVVGASTVVADDCRLTVRHVPGPDPARIVLDPTGRVSDDARAFADDGVRRLVVQAVDRPRPVGVEVIRLDAGPCGFDPRRLVDALAARGLTRLLVEGGATTLSRFLAAGVVDRLHVSIAPLIIGSGPTGLALPPVDRLGEAMRPATAIHRLGAEILVDCDLARRVPFAAAAE